MLNIDGNWTLWIGGHLEIRKGSLWRLFLLTMERVRTSNTMTELVRSLLTGICSFVKSFACGRWKLDLIHWWNGGHVSRFEWEIREKILKEQEF